MIYYTPEMFTVDSIKDILEPLFLEKETLEFQIGIYQQKFDLLRKLNYKELMIYERQKVSNSSLLPSLKVLSQIKSIEKDEAAKEFIQILCGLKRELSNIETLISNEEKKINNMFSFKESNLIKYLNRSSLYFENLISFEMVMRDIFNNEFLNADIYTDVSALRNYEILSMIIKKIPVVWRDFARILYDEAKYVYTLEDLKESSQQEYESFILSEKLKRDARYNKVLSKISLLDAEKSSIKKERLSLDDGLSNRSKELSAKFVRLRADKHKEIIHNLEQSAIARGDIVTKVGVYIKDPSNKLLGA